MEQAASCGSFRLGAWAKSPTAESPDRLLAAYVEDPVSSVVTLAPLGRNLCHIKPFLHPIRPVTLFKS
jgi:hypothetical protein